MEKYLYPPLSDFTTGSVIFFDLEGFFFGLRIAFVQYDTTSVWMDKSCPFTVCKVQRAEWQWGSQRKRWAPFFCVYFFICWACRCIRRAGVGVWSETDYQRLWTVLHCTQQRLVSLSANTHIYVYMSDVNRTFFIVSEWEGRELRAIRPDDALDGTRNHLHKLLRDVNKSVNTP